MTSKHSHAALWRYLLDPRISLELQVFAKRKIGRFKWNKDVPDYRDVVHEVHCIILEFFEDKEPADARPMPSADEYRTLMFDEIYRCVRRLNRRHENYKVDRVGHWEYSEDDSGEFNPAVQSAIAQPATQHSNLEWSQEFERFCDHLIDKNENLLARYAKAIVRLDCGLRIAHNELAAELNISMSQSQNLAKRLRTAYKHYCQTPAPQATAERGAS